MKYRKFSPEFREEAAWMVVEISRPIADVVRELGRPAERQAIPMIAARGARLGGEGIRTWHLVPQSGCG